MRKYITAYYLLFVLLVTGAFASMALNAYGTKLIGLACLGFAFTFLHEAFLNTPRREDLDRQGKVFLAAELVSLAVIALVFFAQSLVLSIVGSSVIFLMFSVVLLLLASRQAWIGVKSASAQDWKLSCVLVCYFGTVQLLILSFVFGMILHATRMLFVALAMIPLVGFVVSLLAFRSLNVQGDSVTPWRYIVKMKNKLMILAFSSVLIYGYSVLNSSGVLPSLYYPQLPNGYFQLVDQGNLSNNPEGRRREREFRERYEQFVQKYSGESGGDGK